MASPAKRAQWTGTERIDQSNPKRVRGVGTTNHCVHGKQVIDEEVLDWSPFEYCTIRLRIPIAGTLLYTYVLAPLDGDAMRTHLSLRLLPQGGIRQRATMAVGGAVWIRRAFEQNIARLAQLLTS